MKLDNPLTLTRLLKDQLSRARMRGHANAADESCEQIIQWLEEMPAIAGKTARTKRTGQKS